MMRYSAAKGLLVSLLCTLLTTTYAQSPAEVKALIKEGVALYDAGKYDEAVLRYRQALKLAPDDFTAQYELALTYGSLGRPEEVVEMSKKLLLNEARADANVYVIYGTALDDLKKPREAVRIYQAGLKKFPDQGLLYYNLGVTQAGLQQYEEAIVSLQQAVRKNPGHASAHRVLGALTAAGGNRVPAVLEYLRFLQLEPLTERSAPNLALLDKLLARGVTPTSDSSVTISLDRDVLKQMNSRKSKPDNFGQADMLLSMKGAKDKALLSKGQLPTERLIEKLGTLLESLAEQKPATRPGFAWEYYVPYFIDLQRAGYLPTLAYLVQASRTAQPEVPQWLEQHSREVKELREWSKAYAWPK
ncbi:tetratricopeptide repeat protein [Hymenobacter algoricola]|uniref:Tetratricopeptide repeat protein n=1 Tax=Hymenobacter algoricola TaxID=486267 RepID=A0ABP7MSX8_9BACT